MRKQSIPSFPTAWGMRNLGSSNKEAFQIGLIKYKTGKILGSILSYRCFRLYSLCSTDIFSLLGWQIVELVVDFTFDSDQLDIFPQKTVSLSHSQATTIGHSPKKSVLQGQPLLHINIVQPVPQLILCEDLAFFGRVAIGICNQVRLNSGPPAQRPVEQGLTGLVQVGVDSLEGVGCPCQLHQVREESL